MNSRVCVCVCVSVYMCSSYSSAQQPQSNVLNAAQVNEAQPQFALYRPPDVVHSTGSPHHVYHPQPAAAAADGAGSNVLNMPTTFNSVAVPAQNLL